MADQSIRGHIHALRDAGELIEFTAEIDPDTDMSAVSFQALSGLGKSSLFSNIKGHPGWRAVSQIVASRRKWGVALGVPEARVVETLNERIARPVEPDVVDRARAPVQEVVKLGSEVDLRQLPAMWTSERDPSRYIAAGMCVIKDPETGIRNFSIHRAQVLGPASTGYLICPRQALRIYQMYEQRNRPMEVAMVIGAHPLIAFSAAFVAPYGVDELTIAGGLLQDPLRLVKCRSVDLEVPAEAEIVLEGEILPGERTTEGPFGEGTGTYAQEGATPVFRVKAVTHRRDPIFYAMMCGLAPSDTHSIVCTTIEMKLWEHLRQVDGGRLDVLDVACFSTVTLMMVVIKMRPKHSGQAKAALLAAVSSPYLHPKFAIAVDEDIDLRDPGQIFWAIATRVHASRDVSEIDSTRIFALDNASPVAPGMSAMYRVGSKLLIDATRPVPPTRSDSGTPPYVDRLAKAFPPNLDSIRLADFLPGGGTPR